MFFYSPSEVVQKAVAPGARLRIGGLVKMGSVVKSANEHVAFVLTDGAHDLKVAYQGLLPDLFREGQGVVAEGVLEGPGQMRAETILAKHDERYMPREVVDALKKQGRWQEGEDGGHAMIVEIGHFALVLALAAALIQTVVPFWGARVGDEALMSVGRNAALIQLALIALAFAALVNAHLTSDFSVLNVAENSNVAMPAIYKISGVWGNHEGSMLLWVLILAIFGGLVALFGRALPARLRADALAVQGLISLAFLAFILLTSNPFERLAPAPFEGRDLNPILQDPGLAIHPPLLYLGYVGFSIVYSFAAAALIEGRIDAAWARFVRPFTLVAWSFLTLGIAAGSFWAYYTLGWGGFWFWDPVENASLMPWLAGTAFVHSVAVMEKRDALKVWTIFLAILAFSFSLLGTFLVRSGVLTSVHAFANDPRRGVFILAILAMFISRLVRALRLARADAQAGRTVRAGLARGRARRQQSAAHHRMRDGPVRHPLSARARAIDRREDHRRRALLQPDLRRAAAHRLFRRAVRLLARLEARRSSGRRAAARLRASSSAP